ncbi:MAG TPA: pyridoxal-phosphate dependent enzyme, partial [Erysipelothrix sp.]|nr:pyridoxal-phosphate dependent enzyme [Erysipelothrix sp.]
GRALGLKVSLVMPESMSIERRNILKAYGAHLILTPAADGMKGAIAKTLELKEADPKVFIAAQFDNPYNVKVHYETTGPELFSQLEGKVDVLVSGIGTGGTITGAGKYLRENQENIHVVAVQPEKSPVLTQGVAGPHTIQGIGAGFIPSILETDIYDEVLDVSDEASIMRAKEFALAEGLGVGISSGAALEVGIQLAMNPKFAGQNIVVVLPDSFDRYYSTKLFTE